MPKKAIIRAEIAKHAKVLETGDHSARIDAIHRLTDFGKEVVPTLIKATKNNDSSVRHLAVGDLGKYGDKRAVPALIEALKDDSHLTRSMAAYSLYQMGWEKEKFAGEDKGKKKKSSITQLQSKRALAKAIKPLGEALNDEHARTYSIMALGATKSEKALPHLERMMNEGEWQDRQGAVFSMIRIKSKKSFDTLFDAALHDDSRHVTWVAAIGAGKVNRRKAVEKFKEVLKGGGPMERANAASALQLLERADALGNLTTALKWEDDPGVKRTIMAQLGFIGGDRVLSSFVGMLNYHDPEVRASAASHMSSVGEEAVPHLVKAFKDRDYRVRNAAFKSLKEIDWELANQLLLDHIDNEAWWVRHTVADQMGDSKREEYIPLLAKLSKDEHPDVREEAVSGLNYYDNEMVIPYLKEATNDINESVWSRAISGLERKKVDIIPYLREALKGRNTEVKGRAIEKIGRVKGEEAIPDIRKYLDSEEPELRFKAAEALYELKDGKSKEKILNILINEHEKLETGSWKINSIERMLGTIDKGEWTDAGN